jgi:hypothetical protein
MPVAVEPYLCASLSITILEEAMDLPPSAAVEIRSWPELSLQGRWQTEDGKLAVVAQRTIDVLWFWKNHGRLGLEAYFAAHPRMWVPLG